MKNRWIAIALALLMLLSLLPASAMAERAPQVLDTTAADRVFATVDEALSKQSGVRSTAAQNMIVKQTVEALGYPVTTAENGRLYWEADGVACTFSPRLYEILKNMKPLDGVVDDAETVTVDYGTRSTGPDARDVVLIEPYYGLDGSFTDQYQKECASLAAATGGQYKLYKTTAATVDVIAQALSSAAVVVFDSHGDTDYADGDDYVSRANTSYLCMQTGAGVTAADQAPVQGPFGSYRHAVNSFGTWEMDGTAFANHMEGLCPNNFLWMAICLGMATDGICGPLMDRGCGVVYGYSQSVTFAGDYRYEKVFWNEMKDGKDVKEAIAVMKEKCGYWDPAMGCNTIEQARRDYAAFPIVVSELDDYPGHGKVDDYQTVYSDWELNGSSTQYDIQVRANDDAFGTVTRIGRRVTAEPNRGYEVGSCSVEPANACTWSVNGNTIFLSDVVSDCVFTVNFVPRTPATVTFSLPDGVTCDPINEFVGDVVTLPRPEGTPTDVSQDYRFLGWIETPLAPTTEIPEDYLKAGTELELTGNRHFFALYSYMLLDGETAAGRFQQITAPQAEWEGEYVLTYDSSVILDASGKYTGSAIGTSPAALKLEEVGAVAVDGALRNIADTQVYVINRVEGSTSLYTIRMKESENYLAHLNGRSSLDTVSDPSSTAANWMLDFVDGAPVIQNANTGFFLRYNKVSRLFRCYESGQMPLTLYTDVQGVFYYLTLNWTGEPCTGEHQLWDSGTVTVAPTCTQPGEKTFICLACGAKRTEEIPALGHDFVDGVCTRCGEEDPDAPDPCADFTDVDREAWYHPAVDYVLKNGLMKGADGGLFAPATTMTRAMLVQVLYNMEPASDEKIARERSAGVSFIDVNGDEWFAPAVLWAAENGIVKGYDDGAFGVNDPVTREQIAAILYRYAADYLQLILPEGYADLSAFPDGGKTDAWAEVALGWAVEIGFISGKSNDGVTLLDPLGQGTRAEVASMLMRFCETVLKNAGGIE